MSGILQAKAAALFHDEQGTVHKDWTGKVAVAVTDPGFRAAYRHLSRRPQGVCERAVVPDPEDLPEYARTRTPLFSLESQRPLTDFDLVLFAVPSEHDCPNVLQVLAIAGIPPLAAERTGAHPLLAMGGVLTSGNPEPLARAYEGAGLA